MKILVFGAGAIGMAFGGFLSRAHDVTLLGRRPHLEAIRRRGLKVSGIWGRRTFRKFHLLSDVRDLVRERPFFDLILVTVKSYDTEEAARSIRKFSHPKAVVLSLQNGLGNIETLHRYLPRRQVLAGRVIFGVEVRDAAEIKVTVIAQPTALGETASQKITARVKYLAREFSRLQLPTVPTAHIQTLLWAKAAYNCALNPLSSLLGCHYGFLGEHPITRLVMNEVICEIYDVARKARVVLSPKTAKGYQSIFYDKLVPRTYDHHPSMLQDLERGRPTEIDALNGAIVRLGKKFHVPTPVNEYLVYLIHQKESS
ncbi:MAG: ketopantoate reductase family protein [Candidatus Omnitrophica bacterium]|nr:ketopantoate reductase family protein [Candidatus Omnitrophota bacterium]